MTMNNLLSGLQIELDTAKMKRINAENDWNRIQNTASSDTIMSGNIKL